MKPARDTHPYDLWRWGQWCVAEAAAPPAGSLRVLCSGLRDHDGCSCWTLESKRKGMLCDS